MIPFLQDADCIIYCGDVEEVLHELSAESVDCVVTSPPFWNLRDYGTAKWESGDSQCDHIEREIRTGLGLAEWSAENARGGAHKAGSVDRIAYRSKCDKCGAVRIDQQLGLESTPEEYVERLVRIF